MEIWDIYGNWNEIANADTVDDVKRSITGNKRAWRPNFCSSALAYVFDYAADEHRTSYNSKPAALDFGCGLGRNGPLLSRFFPDVIGVDLPEMVRRFTTEYAVFAAHTYRNIYNSIDSLIQNQNFCLLYDSVVLQHIIDKEYLVDIMDRLCSVSSFRTLVSIHNASTHPYHLEILKEKGWHVWHTEAETLSFEGASHLVVVLHR